MDLICNEPFSIDNENDLQQQNEFRKSERTYYISRSSSSSLPSSTSSTDSSSTTTTTSAKRTPYCQYNHNNRNTCSCVTINIEYERRSPSLSQGGGGGGRGSSKHITICPQHHQRQHVARSNGVASDEVDDTLVHVNIEIVNQQQQQQQQHKYHHTTTTRKSSYTTYSGNVTIRAPDYVSSATKDPTFLSDRCLKKLLKVEKKNLPAKCTYFQTVQKDITPPMRRIVAEWMMEVCAEEKCQEEVVLLALNYMDRFLSMKSIRKTNLQTLGAACLLLGSKLREPSCRALSAELLVFYTANSIYKSDLIKWELIVLSLLGWDLSTVTPLDFLELFLIRLPIHSNSSTICLEISIEKIRQHAQAFISLAAKDHYFSVYAASTLAAASIAASLNGLNWKGSNLRHLLNLLTDLTGVTQEEIRECMNQMEALFEHERLKLLRGGEALDSQQQHHHQQQQVSHHHSQQLQQHQAQLRTKEYYQSQSQQQPQYSHTLPDLTQTCKMQANSHKDIQDLNTC